eukprot:IDg21151t1
MRAGDAAHRCHTHARAEVRAGIINVTCPSRTRGIVYSAVVLCAVSRRSYVAVLYVRTAAAYMKNILRRFSHTCDWPGTS